MSWSVRWDLAWAAAKDVLLTGTGIVLILSQVLASSPSDVLLATGLALTVPSVASHARVLLAGGRESRSSPPSPPPGAPPSTSSSPAADE